MFFDNPKLDNIEKLLSEHGAQNIHVTSITKDWVNLKFDFLINTQQVCLGLIFQKYSLLASCNLKKRRG